MRICRRSVDTGAATAVCRCKKMKLIIFHQNSDGLVHFMQRSQKHIKCGQATEYYYSGRNVVTIINEDLYFYILADNFTDFIQSLQINPEDFEVVFGDSDDLRRKIMGSKTPFIKDEIITAQIVFDERF